MLIIHKLHNDYIIILSYSIIYFYTGTLILLFYYVSEQSESINCIYNNIVIIGIINDWITLCV